MLLTVTRGKFSALAERLWGRKSEVEEAAALAPEPTTDGPAAAAHAPNAHELLLIDYAARARTQGIDRLLLYLTFDCDTDEDAAAALELDPWLRSRGILAAYAVPGEQLARAADAYGKLAAAGAEFMNHGHVPHAEWREDYYAPITFYDQMVPEEVESDIRQGHATVTALAGRAPRGFRAPHFGSFQGTDQLGLIYRLARELGYAYCSTTLPQTGLEHGPVIDRGGVYEIPTFGSRAAPTAILDSWTYLEDRERFRLGQAYFDLFRDTVDFMLGHDLPGVLTYYADPAHVIGQKPFLDAIEMIAQRRIASATAQDLVALARRAAGAAREPIFGQ